MLPDEATERAITTASLLQPFDVSTAEGRANERHRRAALTTLSSLLARATQLASLLLSVPLAVRYLGAERYGVWMSLSSLAAMLVFADLGLQNALLNCVAQAHGRDDKAEIHRDVTTTLGVLTAAIASVGAVFACAYPWLPLARWLDVSGVAAAEAGPALSTLVACSLMGMFFGALSRVRQALQQGYVNGLFEAAGYVVGLAAMVVAMELGASLPWLVASLHGVPVVASMINGVVLVRWHEPWLMPRPTAFGRQRARVLMGAATGFFLLQLAGALAHASDGFVVGTVLGPEQAARYVLVMRVFGIPTMFMVMLLNALWPAYGEAAARGDVAWVGRTLRRSLVLALAVSALPSLVLVTAGRWLIHLWVGPALVPSVALLSGFAAWTIIFNVANALAIFLNAMSQLRVQLAVAAVSALPTLVAKIMGARWFGEAGVVWATAAMYALLVVVPLALSTYRHHRSMGRAPQSFTSTNGR